MTVLLTKSATKLDKSQNDDWLNVVMYLDPNYNKEVCKGASEGCRKSCLIYSGHMAMQGAIDARKARTERYFEQRDLFMMQLKGEIAQALSKAQKANKRLAVRLNGTSDIDWREVYEAFPMVQFYEYTKRMDLIKNNADLANLDYTFSKHENHSLKNVEHVLKRGINVTVVYSHKVPKEWHGHKVIDGDKHDRRFEDVKGHIVGLKLKGRKHAKDAAIASGFAVES
jgi:hypothetical protein